MKRPFLLLLALTAVAGAQGTRADYERATTLDRKTAGKVFRAKVAPHWLNEGNSFWYRVETGPGTSEHVFVDATKGERIAGLDAAGLATLLTERLGKPVDPKALPGEAKATAPAESQEETEITFINETREPVKLWWVPGGGGNRKEYGSVAPGEKHRQHTFVGHVWRVETAAGVELARFTGRGEPFDAVIRIPTSSTPVPERRREREREREQPKGEWSAFIRESNIWLRHRESREEIQLTRDGSTEDAYREPLLFSPDGSRLLARQVKAAQEHKVYVVESSPKDQLQPRLQSYEYLKPGDRIALKRPRLFDVAARQPIAIGDALFSNPWDISDLRWAPDNSRFTFLYNERGHQVQRIISVDARTGEARAIVEEKSPTFIDYSQKTWSQWLDATGELLWMSERDGWNHLWLYDAAGGAVKTQVTRGEWVVRGVERVDVEARRAWLRVMGVNPGEDPYHVHLARVNLDGTGFKVLTEGDGTHRWEWAPNRRFFIDTWSRVDHPPVSELRSAEDGKLVCSLERGDASALLATGWMMPERFTTKGRDGKTGIYGLIVRPTNFDPAKKYPVIEKIYAGPHDFFVPKEWGRQSQPRALAELGFIVVQIDGMGTNWRSRAFHDVCWKNLKDAGFPDRIPWIKAAAATRPWMDISRVGIYGGSAGGQNALAALLHFGDFYKASVADCGCHDNRMDKIWWNEAWMGWPVGPEYAANSNVTHAAKLTGKLLLTVGEVDHNVDPASTMQVVNALIKADKDFEFLIVPGSDHGAGESPYASRRRADFFVRSLQGVEPRRE
jgi:dipeptidyl-peptidase 4